jgi:hypothetical protein
MTRSAIRGPPDEPFDVRSDSEDMTNLDDVTRAQAYRVDTHDGRIGTVDAVVPRADGRPGLLLVHTGLLTCRLAAVPFSEVEDVNPAERRVVLRHAPLRIP